MRPLTVSLCLLLLMTAGWTQTPWRDQAGRWTETSHRWNRAHHTVISGFHNMYNLHVIHDPGAPYPFQGWFFGWAVKDCNAHLESFTGCDAMFHCRARQIAGPWEVWTGQGWDVGGSTPGSWRPVIVPDNKPYDSWHNGDPSVVKHRGVYYMAYSASGHDLDGIPAHLPGDTDGSALCIMGATSRDGIVWTRTERPILMASNELGTTVPEGDSAPDGSYCRPSLMRDGNRWKLWFDYWNAQTKTVDMGYAENRGDFANPAHWKVIRAGNTPALGAFPNPDVVKVGRMYHAFGDPPGYGEGWASRQICEAVSPDGVNWTPAGWLKPDPDTPAQHTPEALVVSSRGRTTLYLFYACQIGGEPDYNWRYDRILVISRSLDSKEPQ